MSSEETTSAMTTPTPCTTRKSEAKGITFSPLNCQVCLCLPESNVYVCSNGHPICDICKPKINNCCPTCLVPFGDARNRIAEQIAAKLDRSCGYDYCSFEGDRDAVEEHRKTCEHRPYVCPLQLDWPCDWKGSKNDLIEHIRKNHNLKTERLQNRKAKVRLIPANMEAFVVGSDRQNKKFVFGWDFVFYDNDNDLFILSVRRDSTTNCFLFFVRSEVEGTRTKIQIVQSENRSYSFTLTSRSFREEGETTVVSPDNHISLPESVELFFSKQNEDDAQPKELKDLNLRIVFSV